VNLRHKSHGFFQNLISKLNQFVLLSGHVKNTVPRFTNGMGVGLPNSQDPVFCTDFDKRL